MPHVQFKTFIKAIAAVSQQPKLAKSFLNDKRLSYKEVKLLMAALALRDGDLTSAEGIIVNAEPFSNACLKGISKLILGTIKNNQANYYEAIELSFAGLSLLEKIDISRLKFSAYRTIFYSSYNLFWEEKTLEALELLKDYVPKNVEEEIAIDLAEFAFAIRFQEDLNKAGQLKTKLERQKSSFTEVQFIQFYYDLMDMTLIQRDFHRARTLLGELKRHRKYYDKHYFEYTSSILNYLIDKKTIYLYAKLKENSIYNFLEIEVINSLLKKDFEKARESWGQLQGMMPNLYKPDFEINHRTYLLKYLLDELKQTVTIETPQLDPSATKIDKVLFLLQHYKGGISKDDLYQQVWGEAMNEKNDIVKMSKVLSLIKKKYSMKIEYKNGTYKLVS